MATPNLSRTRAPGRVSARTLGAADRLHTGALRLLRQLRGTDRESGVGPARLSALSVLVMGGPRTVTELARAEDVRPPTMTRIVQGLVDSGLAARRRDRDDARVVHVRATRKGERTLQAARSRRVEQLARRLRALDAADRRALEGALGALDRLLAVH